MFEETLDTQVNPTQRVTRVIESFIDKEMFEETLDTRVNPTQRVTRVIESSIDRETLDTQVDPIERVTGVIKQIMDPEQCSSTSVQLVQLPTQPIAPGVSMIETLETHRL